MDGEIIDKEVEPKKFNWWHLGFDLIISCIISLISIFGVLYFLIWSRDIYNIKYNSLIGFPFKFMDMTQYAHRSLKGIHYIELLLNFLFYFVIIFFLLRYKNIKFSKRK